jgi:hypothetical protein
VPTTRVSTFADTNPESTRYLRAGSSAYTQRRLRGLIRLIDIEAWSGPAVRM